MNHVTISSTPILQSLLEEFFDEMIPFTTEEDVPTGRRRGQPSDRPRYKWQRVFTDQSMRDESFSTTWVAVPSRHCSMRLLNSRVWINIPFIQQTYASTDDECAIFFMGLLYRALQESTMGGMQTFHTVEDAENEKKPTYTLFADGRTVEELLGKELTSYLLAGGVKRLAHKWIGDTPIIWSDAILVASGFTQYCLERGHRILPDSQPADLFFDCVEGEYSVVLVSIDGYRRIPVKEGIVFRAIEHMKKCLKPQLEYPIEHPLGLHIAALEEWVRTRDTSMETVELSTGTSWMANAHEATMSAVLGGRLAGELLKLTNDPPNMGRPNLACTNCVMLMTGLAYDTQVGVCTSANGGEWRIVIATSDRWWATPANNEALELVGKAFYTLCDQYIGGPDEDKASALIQNYNNWVETYVTK